MFAAVQTKNYITYYLYGFFMSVHIGLYLKNIRLFKSCAYPYRDMSMVLGRTKEANSLFCINTFHNSYAMTKNDEFCNAGNNSICTATFAHETCAVSLSGDPYKDLAAFGFDLHRCQITYRKSPNKNGHTVTGRFNISGRTETGAGNSYPELILYVVSRQLSHLLYISLCHKQKCERNFASWLSRHPEYVAINQ